MNTLIIIGMFFIPTYQADYRCDMHIEVNILCELPVVEWYIEPYFLTDWRLA